VHSTFKLNNRLFVVTLLLMCVPLGISLGNLTFFIWFLPASFIMLNNFRTNTSVIGNRKDKNIYRYQAVLFFVLLITTVNNVNSTLDNFRALFTFGFVLLIGYSYKGIMYTITEKTLYNVSFVILSIEVLIVFIQFLTDSDVGNVKNYFGQSNEFSLKNIEGSGLYRLVGTFGHSNILAAFLNVFLVILLYTRANRKYVAYEVFLISLTIFAIILTFSRGNIIILLVNLSIYFFIYRQKTEVYKIVLPFMFIIPIVFIWGDSIMLAFDQIFNAYGMRSAQDIKNTYIKLDRLVMNLTAIEYIAENPFSGLGFNNSSELWFLNSNFSSLKYISELKEIGVHNIFLLMAVEGSLISGLLYTFVVSYPLYKLLKLRNKNNITYMLISLLISFIITASIYIMQIGPLLLSVQVIFLGFSVSHLKIMSK